MYIGCVCVCVCVCMCVYVCMGNGIDCKMHNMTYGNGLVLFV